jgi:hypothetical protein
LTGAHASFTNDFAAHLSLWRDPIRLSSPFLFGGLLGGPAFKTDTGQIILFFKKVTGSIR